MAPSKSETPVRVIRETQAGSFLEPRGAEKSSQLENENGGPMAKVSKFTSEQKLEIALDLLSGKL